MNQLHRTRARLPLLRDERPGLVRRELGRILEREFGVSVLHMRLLRWEPIILRSEEDTGSLPPIQHSSRHRSLHI